MPESRLPRRKSSGKTDKDTLAGRNLSPVEPDSCNSKFDNSHIDAEKFREALLKRLNERKVDTEEPTPSSRFSITSFASVRTISLVIVIASTLIMSAVYASLGPLAWGSDVTTMMGEMFTLANSKSSYRSQVIKDDEMPKIGELSDIVAEATGRRTFINITSPSVNDNVDPSPTLTNDIPRDGFPVGQTLIRWTAIDDAGLIAEKIQKVTILDTKAPTLVAPEDIVIVVEPSITGYPLADLGKPQVTDLVDSSPTITNDANQVFPRGISLVTWSAMDASGNLALDVQRVEIVEKIAGLGSSDQLELGEEPADAFSEPNDSADRSEETSIGTSNVSTPTSTTYTTSGGGGGGGGGGSSSSGSENENPSTTISDTTPPNITAPPFIIASATGPLTVLSIGEANATDDIDPEPEVMNSAPENGFPLGMTIVIWFAVDDYGNVASAEQRIFIEDDTPPTITAPANIIAEATGFGTAVFLGEPVVNDLVDASPVISNDADPVFPLGTTSVTWTATDASENSATSVQLVTIIDTTPPVIIAPADQVEYVQNENDRVVIALGSPTIIELGDSAPAVTNDAPHEGFAVGNTTVIWTVTDSAGYSSNDTQLVTILVEEDQPSENDEEDTGSDPSTDPGHGTNSTDPGMELDTTPPIIVAPSDITIEATGPLTFVELGTASVTDTDDPLPTVIVDAPADRMFPVGNTTVNWTAIDASGNSASDTQLVTIEPISTSPEDVPPDNTNSTNDNEDLTPPTIIAPPAIIQEGTGTLTEVELGTPTVSDLVDTQPIVSNDAPVDGFVVGTTVVTWTATDSSGNVASASQSVTVTDTGNPIIVVPEDFMVEASGPAGAPVDYSAEVSAHDSVDGTLIADCDPSSGDIFGLGTTTVSCSASDSHGNDAVAEFDVTVQDTTAPTIIPPAPIIINAVGLLTSISLGSATASDTVDNSPSIVNDAPLSGFPVGNTIVNWTATDASGNKGTASQIISVLEPSPTPDISPPSIIAPADIISDATGTLTIVELGTPIVTDSQDPSPTITNNAPLNGFPVGTTTVTWTATDASGNSATATQDVVIQSTSYYTIPTIAGIKPNTVIFGSTLKTVCDSGCSHTSIKNAINALPSDGGKVLLKGAKSYSITGTITLRSNLVVEFEEGASISHSGSGKVFSGNGINNVMFVNPVISRSSADDVLYFINADTIIIKEATITGVKGSSSSAFECKSCKNVLVQGGTFSSFSRIIDIGTTSSSTDGSTRNIWIEGTTVSDSSIECIKINRGYEMHAIDNDVRDCSNNGVDVGFNIGAEAVGNVISHAGFGTTDNAVGIHTDSSNLVVLVGNLIEYSGTNGITVCGSDNNYVVDNVIRYSGQTVTDTRFVGDGNGIEVISCTGGTTKPDSTIIDQNTVTDSEYGFGIYVGSSATHSYVTANILLNNEKGAYKNFGSNTTINGNTTS